MGTFNYRRSEFITLAFEEYCISDFDNDKPEIIENMMDNGYRDITETEYDNYICELISSYEEDDYTNIEHSLKKHNFNYFIIEISGGYYSGSQLEITFDESKICNYTDKREAQKEITRIKNFLITCAAYGMRATVPFWCPTWYSYAETLEKIKEAVKEMRQAVRNTETENISWLQYRKQADIRKGA